MSVSNRRFPPNRLHVNQLHQIRGKSNRPKVFYPPPLRANFPPPPTLYNSGCTSILSCFSFTPWSGGSGRSHCKLRREPLLITGTDDQPQRTSNNESSA